MSSKSVIDVKGLPLKVRGTSCCLSVRMLPEAGPGRRMTGSSDLSLVRFIMCLLLTIERPGVEACVTLDTEQYH